MHSNTEIKAIVVDEALMCGDFRQILPVTQGGTRGNIVDSYLKQSYSWENVVVMHLNTNMRVHLCGDQTAGKFSKQWLTVGDGAFAIHSTDVIQLPNMTGTFVLSMDKLV